MLGTRLDVVTADEFADWTARALAEPWDGHCRQIATLNPEYVMASRGSIPFREALASADLVTADGVGVVLAARVLHGVRLARITGIDALEHLAGSGVPLFLLGAGPGVAEAAAARLMDRHAGARIAGHWSDGTPYERHDTETMNRISASGAKVVAVAYGAPGQVLWIARNQKALAQAGVRVAIGVGGAFDYAAGRVKRAPAPMRRLGLEWLYRLVSEPRRWRRQLVLPHFALLITVEAVRGRWLPPPRKRT